MTAQDIITNALIEIGAHSPGESVSAAEATFALSKLNDLIDEWAARKAYVYNIGFNLYTLTANHSPHLIGPGLNSPDFAASQRPVKLEGATLVLNTSTPATDLPLNIRDDKWWNYQRVKSLTSSIPTDLYYSPDWPNGSLYLWPIPTVGYQLRLESWGLLTQFATLTTAFSLPPGYRKAITLTLAESLCPSYERQVNPELALQASSARMAVQGNNISSPRMRTAEAGQGGSNDGGFNWQTGQSS